MGRLDRTHEVAFFIEEHDELGAELLAYYSDIEEARKAIEEGSELSNSN